MKICIVFPEFCENEVVSSCLKMLGNSKQPSDTLHLIFSKFNPTSNDMIEYSYTEFNLRSLSKNHTNKLKKIYSKIFYSKWLVMDKYCKKLFYYFQNNYYDLVVFVNGNSEKGLENVVSKIGYEKCIAYFPFRNDIEKEWEKMKYLNDSHFSKFFFEDTNNMKHFRKYSRAEKNKIEVFPQNDKLFYSKVQSDLKEISSIKSMPKKNIKNLDLYVCYTYYHALVALCKVMTTKEKNADIILCSTIPNYKKFASKIEKQNIFDHVETINEYECWGKGIFETYGVIDHYIFARRRHQKIIAEHSRLDINFSKYQNVYMFQNYSLLGNLIQDTRKSYIYPEDGTDSYSNNPRWEKNIEQQKENCNKRKNFLLRYWMREHCATDYLYFGAGNLVTCIEVNKKDGVKYFREKLKECNKAELFKALSLEQKEKLKLIFCERLQISKSDKRLLLLTQPLYSDKDIPTLEQQYQIYKKILDEYKEYVIYIKPHPREDLNYKKMFAQALIIDKNMPSEILNFFPDIRFNIVITIFSTAINLFTNIDKKVILGRAYIEKFLEDKTN